MTTPRSQSELQGRRSGGQARRLRCVVKRGNGPGKMLNEFSSVWAILTRLTELVLWLIAQLTASINTINDHESRIDELERAGGGGGGGDGGDGGTTGTTPQDGDTIQVTEGVVFIDASSGPVHITLASPTPSTTPLVPLIHFVCVSASNPNSISPAHSDSIVDSVGNLLENIRFINSGQSVTLTRHAPTATWFVVGKSFSGTLISPPA